MRIRVSGEEERIGPEKLEEMASEFISQDPNFPEDTPALFRGVLLERFLDKEKDLVLLSEDQYMAHFDMAFMREHGAMLAWAQDGKPIPRHKGGPLKVVFRKHEGLNPSANAWYVKVLVPGKEMSLPLKLVKGTKNFRLEMDSVLQEPGSTRDMLPPIPKGYRHTAVSPSRQQVSGFEVTALLNSLGLSWKTLVLRPLVGKELRLTRKEVEGRDLFLFSRKGETGLFLSCGGPWALWAPAHLHPELVERLPNPDGLFFVREIFVE